MTMINCLTCAPEGYKHDEADRGVDGVGGDHLPVDPGQVGSVLRHCLGRHAVLGPLVVAALIQSGAGGVPVLDTHLDSNLLIFFMKVWKMTPVRPSSFFPKFGISLY